MSAGLPHFPAHGRDCVTERPRNLAIVDVAGGDAFGGWLAVPLDRLVMLCGDLPPVSPTRPNILTSLGGSHARGIHASTTPVSFIRPLEMNQNMVVELQPTPDRLPITQPPPAGHPTPPWNRWQ